jgi:hypothetical protein
MFIFFAGSAAFSGLSYGWDCRRLHRDCNPRVSMLVVWFPLFIVYQVACVVTITMSPEFSLFEPVWSLDEYEDFLEAMRMGQVQVMLEGATHDCTMNPIAITGVSSTDASVFPNVSAVLDLVPVVSLHSELGVHWNPESANLLKESVEEIKRCRWNPFEPVNVTQTDMGIGWKERVLITKDGELPIGMRRGSAIAAVIFGSGLYYIFQADSTPRVMANVIKNDARIDGPTTLCGNLEWTCG